MPRIPIELPPGLYRNGTENQSRGRWYDGELVRFHEGTVRPVGGFKRKSDEGAQVRGKARSMLIWTDDLGNAWVGAGSHNGLFAMDRSGAVSDITPLRATAALADPFATSLGSAGVTVSHVAHGAAAGEFVVFSGALAVGGLVLNGVFEIVSVISADAYQITAASPADSPASGGGAVTAGYQIGMGEESSSLEGGYGNHLYGAGAYGTPRPDTSTPTPIRVWSLDTWGKDLIACPDGAIYAWDANAASPAAVIPGAPTARAAHVTAERILMALGADGNPRKVRWSDREDREDWTPSTLNLAGDWDLQSAGHLMCGRRVRGGSLLLTTADAWLAEFVDSTFVYGFEKKGEGCGIIAKGAIATIDGDAVPANAVWMGTRSFWVYSGGFVSPLACDVGDLVFSSLNRRQAQKVTAVHNTDWGEVWFFYPSGVSNEIDSYVAWSYRENHWTRGTLARLAGSEKGPLANPLMVDEAGVIFEHEAGFDYGGKLPFVESGPFTLEEGDRTVHVRAVIGDERTRGDVRLSFFLRDEAKVSPQPGMIEPVEEREREKQVVLADERVDVRFAARRARIRFSTATLGDWRVGRFQLDGVVGGWR